ncbi:uncharacterized protein PRCAT00004129001 [Priceomyces carsonii]|uniref:uncharacterized protein n=1 Tax=Priceomyces carsonii TaxID=28549 RepID=UPI002EDA917A|nr:unnamed protein product [Priceomyces carsonii]
MQISDNKSEIKMTDAASLSVSQIEELIQKKIDASSISLSLRILEEMGKVKCTLDKVESELKKSTTNNPDDVKDVNNEKKSVHDTTSFTSSSLKERSTLYLPNFMVEKKKESDLEIKYNLARRLNATRRSAGVKAEPVPFLKSGEKADYLKEVLPPINSVEEIDRISKDQCEKYLELYHVFHDEETVFGWKDSLREAVGLNSWGDSNFEFSEFK